MKKLLVLQITLLIIFSGAIGGLLTQTEVYNDVFRKIVDELCLSCIKLKPNTIKEYRFLPDSSLHPDFVIENLTKGPVILAYRITFCPGCIELEHNVLSKVFNTTFPDPLLDNENNEIPDLLYLEREFKNTNVTFIHFNTDDENSLDVPPDGIYAKSRHIYDIVGDAGSPMVVFITYGYNHGFIEPYYCTLYSIESIQECLDLIYESIDLYNEHKEAH
jgi:hypothetical protein